VQAFVDVGKGVAGAVEQQIITMLQFFQALLARFVVAVVFAVPDQAADRVREQVFPVRVDHEAGRLAERRRQLLRFVHATVERKRNVEGAGEFTDLVEGSVVLVGVGVQDEHRGVMVQ
jgi:hypothetical protein